MFKITERRLELLNAVASFSLRWLSLIHVVLFDLPCIGVVNQFQISVSRKLVRNAQLVIEFSLPTPRNGSAISLSSLLSNFLQKHSASLTSYVAPNWLVKYFIRCLDRLPYLIDRWITGRLNCKVGHQRLAFLHKKKEIKKRSLKEYILL